MRRLLSTAILLPVLLLPACGSGTTKVARKPVDIVRLAGQNTAEAGSAKMAMDMSGTGFTMSAEGVTSLEEIKGAMTITMSLGGQEIEMQMVMLDQVIYMKMPAGLPNPSAKPWVKLDLEVLSKKAGFDITALQQLKNADPTAALAYFEGVSDDVTEIGPDDVRGEATTKYTATFNLEKAKAALDDEDAKQAIDAVIKQLGVSEIPATVWIDDKGRMRKMEQTIDLSKAAGAAGATGAFTMTFELYDFGVAVDVVAPPADQVGDGAALFGGASG